MLCVEVLAEKIRKNQNIKGIMVSQNEVKISQYADDTSLILDGSRESLISALQVLENFSKVSGLKLNNKKTEALWIGANKERDDVLCPEINLKWIKYKGKALGVWFSTNPEEALEANYTDKLPKVSNCLSCWELRRLSLLGKVTVLKSLIASQLVYILTPSQQTNKSWMKLISCFSISYGVVRGTKSSETRSSAITLKVV